MALDTPALRRSRSVFAVTLNPAPQVLIYCLHPRFRNLTLQQRFQLRSRKRPGAFDRLLGVESKTGSYHDGNKEAKSP